MEPYWIQSGVSFGSGQRREERNGGVSVEDSSSEREESEFKCCDLREKATECEKSAFGGHDDAPVITQQWVGRLCIVAWVGVSLRPIAPFSVILVARTSAFVGHYSQVHLVFW